MNGAPVMEVEVDEEEIGIEESAVDKFLGSSFSLERAGMVRPGIMVPKNACPENLKELYTKLVAQNKSWDDIAKAMGEDSSGKTWLTMRNVDYFTLRPQDCANPSHADLFRQMYAPDGLIKRVPIVIPFDEIDKLISIRLSMYSKTGLLAQGTYRGEELICQTPKPIQQQGQKQLQTFGRPEYNEKPCDPEKCSFYQSQKCKMRGAFIFRIPGMPGLGVWALYTSSWNSMKSLRNKLTTIKKDIVNGWGSLSHLPADMFYLTKFKKRVGREQKEQWLITIDSDYPVDQIVATLKKDHDQRTRTQVGAAAAKVLNGAPEAKTLGTGEGVDTTTGEIKTAACADASKSQGAASHSGLAPEAPKEPAKSAPVTPTVEEKTSPAPQAPAPQGAAAGKQQQGTAAAPFAKTVQPYLRGEMRKNPVFNGVADTSLWAGVIALSKKLFNGKDPREVTEVEAKQLVDAIKKDILEGNVGLFGGPAVQPSPAPPTTGGADSSFMDGGELPEDIPGVGVFAGGSAPAAPVVEKKAPAPQAPAPQGAPAGQGDGLTIASLPKTFGSFVQAIMKNPALAKASEQDVMTGLEAFAQRAIKKSLTQIDDKDATALRSLIQTHIKANRLAQELMFGR